ncbi:class I SAM-dependent methyltransferase [Pseudofrankia sp. BMG5.37]|uniref:class I SAM-dependent methyltransferase n=1 Tax=Pseudofrankia sp. BMG5.37 TaxID=3050035 RepID=UPI002895A1F2|nr:class I SAM-dependent methyltransferase [Pseudofrankia sp. BMG5.37]MDT3442652.1 class I SAM-dependent methyltransferase [Pseudofrankia sp. BMG5.37]
MNPIHRIYCRSRRWACHLTDLLPWATADVRLTGQRVLELGSGPGQTTNWLLPRAGSLTAVEYDTADASALAARLPNVEVLHADATDLPCPDESFDVVVCFTMLHHVATTPLQNRLFAEARRVLRPGGIFAGSDSRWGPLFAVAHIGDTMHLVNPRTLAPRLVTAGFTEPRIDTRWRTFRFRAIAPS